MKQLLVAFLLLVTSHLSIAHAADVPADKRKEIEKMLRLTGMEKLMGQMKAQMISSFRRNISDAPPEFWDEFEKKMDMHELIEKIIPLYDKYYSLEDLKAVNAFYESPAGQKILATMPQIMQESMKVGEEWGRKLGQDAAAAAAAAKKKP